MNTIAEEEIKPRSPSVVIVMGRFNPPTLAHESQIILASKTAKQNGSDRIIFVSDSDIGIPLSSRLQYVKTLFGGTVAPYKDGKVLDLIKTLSKKYKDLTVISSADKAPLLQKMLTALNPSRFKFRKIQVLSYGAKEPDSLYGSKINKTIADKNYTAFKATLPRGVKDIDARRLMNDIMVSMGINTKPQIKLETNTIREQFYSGTIFNIGESVECNGAVYDILDRGSNYLTVSDSDGNISKKWLNEVRTYNKLNEDIPTGYAPDELSFKGYKTKNLHHSEDAVRAFQQTIQRVGHSDPLPVLNALKATDAYMGMNDAHLEQGKAPDDTDLVQWRANHGKAREWLERVGEFLHHMDYWHAHKHEIDDMETEYTPKTAGAEMSESKIKTPKVESPVVNTKSTFNIGKSNLGFKDYVKLSAMASGKVTSPSKDPEDLNSVEQDMTAVGGLSYPPSKMNTNSRYQRIRYQIGESKQGK